MYVKISNSSALEFFFRYNDNFGKSQRDAINILAIPMDNLLC